MPLPGEVWIADMKKQLENYRRRQIGTAGQLTLADLHARLPAR
jgi:hypothetical protein